MKIIIEPIQPFRAEVTVKEMRAEGVVIEPKEKILANISIPRITLETLEVVVMNEPAWLHPAQAAEKDEPYIEEESKEEFVEMEPLPNDIENQPPKAKEKVIITRADYEYVDQKINVNNLSPEELEELIQEAQKNIAGYEFEEEG